MKLFYSGALWMGGLISFTFLETNSESVNCYEYLVRIYFKHITLIKVNQKINNYIKEP